MATLTWRRLERGGLYRSACGRYEIARRDGWWRLTDVRRGATRADGWSCRSLRGAMAAANQRAKREPDNGR